MDLFINSPAFSEYVACHKVVVGQAAHLFMILSSPNYSFLFVQNTKQTGGVFTQRRRKENKQFHHIMKRGDSLRRDKDFTINISIEVNGEIVPYLTIDKNGKVTQLASDEDRDKYRKAMLKNMGDTMSRYYSAHPEKIH